MSLIYKQSGFSFIIAGIYILPKRSPYGYKCDKWFNHLASVLARYEKSDCFLIIGDLNTRISHGLYIIDTLE